MGKISLIFSASQLKDGNLGIYTNSRIPWNIPENTEFFRRKTLGKIVVMDYNTFNSIGKILDRCTNVILSNDQNLKIEEAIVINDIEILTDFMRNSDKEVFIIGSKELYEYYIDIVDNIYLTEIQKEIACNIVVNRIPDNFTVSDYSEIIISNWMQFRFIHYIKSASNNSRNLDYIIASKEMS